MMNNRDAACAGATFTTDRIACLKVHVDVLLRQLSEGEYLSLDTFANNWVHLTSLYETIQLQMNDRILMDRLVRTDLLLTADLLAVGRMIVVINNFLRITSPVS